MSLLFNILSRLVIAFLRRSKHPLSSRLPLPSAVILEPPKNKVSYCFHCFPVYYLCCIYFLKDIWDASTSWLICWCTNIYLSSCFFKSYVQVSVHLKYFSETSLVVQWLRICLHAGNVGSILGRELRSHMLRGISPHREVEKTVHSNKDTVQTKKIFSFSKNNHGGEQRLRNKAMEGHRKK